MPIIVRKGSSNDDLPPMGAMTLHIHPTVRTERIVTEAERRMQIGILQSLPVVFETLKAN